MTRYAGAATLAVLIQAVPGLAQQVPVDPPGCTAAENALEGRKSGPAYHEHLQALASCPAAGPRAFRLQWMSPPVEATAVRLLADVSSSIRDRRILEAVRDASFSDNNSQEVRLAAIRTMISYFDPSVAVHFQPSPDTSLPAAAYVMLGRWEHPVGRDGEQALGPSMRAEVLGILRQLEQGPGDPIIAKVAGYLARRLAK